MDAETKRVMEQLIDKGNLPTDFQIEHMNYNDLLKLHDGIREQPETFEKYLPYSDKIEESIERKAKSDEYRHRTFTRWVETGVLIATVIILVLTIVGFWRGCGIHGN
jgi:hypothetical protein